MVDVMLVLLIIFMAAAPLLTVGVPVDLPKTAAKKLARTDTPLVVSIDAGGGIFLGEEALPLNRLFLRLRDAAREAPGRVVLVRGDGGVDYRRVMDVVGQVNAAGFAKISLVAEAAAPGS